MLSAAEAIAGPMGMARVWELGVQSTLRPPGRPKKKPKQGR